MENRFPDWLRGSYRRLRTALGGPRPWRAGGWLAGIVAAALIVALVAANSARRGHPRAAPSPPRPQIIGYFQNGWSRIFTDSFISLRQHPKVVDTVLAYWYSVDGSGNLREPAGPPRQDVIQYVRAHGMRMGVLINNLGHDMLTTPAVQAHAISQIVGITKKDGYREIHIDFELLPSNLRDAFTTFMAGLRKALPPSVALSVSVFPKIGVTSDVNGVYDYQALAKSVNYEVIMLYDHHSPGGPAGPVSPWPWVLQNVAYFRSILPADEIVVAAGVYGYDWPLGSTQAQEWPLDYIVQLSSQHHATVQTDPVSHDPYFHYTDNSGNQHVVWFQNSATVKERINLVAQDGLRGIAIWALGQEDQKVWQVLEETK